METDKDNSSYCDQCGAEISSGSLLVIADANGNRVCSEDCQDQANFDISRDQ